MHILHPTITDDRGRTCRLVKHAFALPFKMDPDKQARYAKVASSVDPMTNAERRRIVYHALMVLPVVIAYTLVPVFLTSVLKLGWMAVPLAIPLGLVPMMLIVFVARRATGHRIARQYLRAEYCPSCEYDLRTIGPRPTGARSAQSVGLRGKPCRACQF